MYREVESYVDLKSTMNQFEIIMIIQFSHSSRIQILFKLP